jgi:hypothetical protein
VGYLVNGLTKLWETYVTLYNLLQGWAVTYVSENASRKVARFATARLFGLACIAWETTDGPLAEAGDLATLMLIDRAWDEGSITLGAPGSTIPIPGEAFLYDLSQAYATVYQLSYLGNWSTADRETVAMHIRMYDPEFHDPLWLKLHLAGPGELAPVLRRAVDAADNHRCGELLVCTVAEHIWADEDRRSQAWLKYRTS